MTEIDQKQLRKEDKPISIELKNPVYYATVLLVKPDLENDSIEVIYTIDGQTTQQVVTFQREHFNRELRGMKFDELANLQNGQRIQLQNESSSNVPGQIRLMTE